MRRLRPSIRQALVLVLGIGFAPMALSGQQASSEAEYQPTQLLALRPPILPAAPVPPKASSDLTPSSAAPLVRQDSTQDSWWVRHPTATGILAGMGVGLGVYYLQASRDPYCRDPDFFPCELAIPLYMGRGAVAGGLLGYIAGRIFR
jgi:hypothetical protein